MVDANLLVTHEPSHAGSAKEEVMNALKAAKQKAKFLKSDVEGVFKLRASKPKNLVKNLGKLKKKMFQYTFYWVPIDKWTTSSINSMQKAVKNLQKGIKKNERWKMDLHKRHFDDMHSTELIIKLTEVVDKPKVDLENPKKILEVQIIGKKAGLALLNKDEILSL